MAPAKPTSFKSYETQARLLAATLAAHPELKPNYKEIARHYGSTQTPSAIEHRFRPLRSAAGALRKMVENNQDPALLEDVFQKDSVEIAQHFGGSTPDGIQFQFRQVKASAEVLKKAVKNGEDPVEAFATANGLSKNALPTGAAPSSRKRIRAPATPKPKAGGSAGTGASRTKSARKTKSVKYQEEEEEDDESSNVDYSELDGSPTKHTKKVKTTPAKVSKAPETTTAANKTASAVNSNVPTLADDGDDDVIFMKEEFVKDDLLPTSSASQPQSSSGTRESTSAPTSHGGNGYAFRAGNGYTSQAGYASNYGYGHNHSYGGYPQSSEFNDYLESQIGQGFLTTNNATDYDEETFANASDDDPGAI